MRGVGFEPTDAFGTGCPKHELPRHRKACLPAPLTSRDVVVRNLEVIGEATKRLSKETGRLYPEIPWAEVAGARDRLIHACFDVDLNEVWITVRRDIPRLRSTIEKAIAELSASEGR